MIKRFTHRPRGDFVVSHTEKLIVGNLARQQRLEVPGDRLSLTVGIGRQIDFFTLGRGFTELLDKLLALRRHLILGLEIMLKIHPETADGKIPDMPHRGLHGIVSAQDLINGLRLGGRLHDH